MDPDRTSGATALQTQKQKSMDAQAAKPLARSPARVLRPCSRRDLDVDGGPRPRVHCGLILPLQRSRRLDAAKGQGHLPGQGHVRRRGPHVCCVRREEGYSVKSCARAA